MIKWDEWKEVFLIPHPIKLVFFRNEWPIRQWIKQAGLNKDSKILDIGCGGGSTGLSFLVKHFNVFFADKSKIILADCRENIQRTKRFFPNLNTRLSCQDILNTGFKDSSFDLVVNDGLYEHFVDKESRRKLIFELIRIVKNQGHILISIPNNFHPFLKRWIAMGHDYINPTYPYKEIIISAEEFKNEITAFGLTNVIVDGWKVYDSLYRYRGIMAKMIGWIFRFFFPPPPHSLRIKFGNALFALAEVKKS